MGRERKQSLSFVSDHEKTLGNLVQVKTLQYRDSVTRMEKAIAYFMGLAGQPEQGQRKRKRQRMTLDAFLAIETNRRFINAVIDDCGHSLIHVALLEDEREVFEWLLRYGADINVKTGAGYTPLHLAVIDHIHWAIPLLLENGADRADLREQIEHAIAYYQRQPKDDSWIDWHIHENERMLEYFSSHVQHRL